MGIHLIYNTHYDCIYSNDNKKFDVRYSDKDLFVITLCCASSVCVCCVSKLVVNNSGCCLRDDAATTDEMLLLPPLHQSTSEMLHAGMAHDLLQ